MADLTRPFEAEREEATLFARFYSHSLGVSLLSVALAYLAATELGHALTLQPGNFAAFWPAAGVYLAALLLLPARRWPLVIVAAGLGNIASDWLIHGESPRISLAFFAVNTVSTFLSAWLVLHRCGRPFYLDRLRSILVFLGCTALTAAMVAAPACAAISWSAFGGRFGGGWARWWLADLAGVWLTTPLVLGFAQIQSELLKAASLRRAVEAVALYASLMAVAFAVHDHALPFPWVPNIVMMWVIWAVLRFGSAGVGSAMFIVAVTATASLVHGRGPFLRSHPADDALLRLLLFLSIWTGCFYMVAAILAELRLANEAFARMNLDLERSVARRTRSLAEATDALRDSESKLRSYYESAGLSMGLVEIEGDDIRHVYDNPASCRFLGVGPGETAGRLASELGTPRSVIDIWLENYRRSAVERRPMKFEHAYLTPGGERWLSATVAPIAGDGAASHCFSYLAADVTERRQNENAVRRHASRQAALLDFTRTILSRRADAEALGEAVFEKLSGVLDADIGLNYRLDLAKSELTLVAAHGLSEELTARARSLKLNEAFCGTVAATRQPLQADAEMIETDPKGVFVRTLGARAYACNPILASDGRVLGALSFGSTTRDSFEPEEVDFIQTLCHFVAMAWERSTAEGEMLKAKEGAESANRAKDEFLAALSHELRTPLNPVLLLASELQKSAGISGEVRDDLATIRRNVELEARLIDDLLDLTRITRGKVRLDLRPVAAHQAMRDALEILRGDMEGKDLAVTVDLSALEEHVSADPVRLQQVFWNLLRNAIKFTPRGGAVAVRTRSENGRFIAEISDTGLGIETSQLEKIFDTFHQGDGGHRFGGLGLGLAIARSLVQAHGGGIQATSDGLGCGATFRLELPLISPLPSEGIAPTATVLPAVEPRLRRSLRILLLEDHEPTREALIRMLGRRGHDVSAAANLVQARALVESRAFDLFISDLGLPDGDGTALMRDLAAAGGPPGIALSGYGMEEDIQRSLDGGFAAHLVKPVDVDLLDRTMARWVEA